LIGRWLCGMDLHRWHRFFTKRTCRRCKVEEFQRYEYWTGFTFWGRR
jgi:hypothetical protein